MREVLLEIYFVRPEKPSHLKPWHKNSINIAVLSANEVLLVLERSVEHTGNTPDLVNIALDRTGDLLGVVDRKPGGLPEVRSLAGHLVV